MSFARRVIGGTGVITVAGVTSRVLSFLTVPILSRLLGPEPYGIAALVGTAVALGSTLGLLGIDMAYARFFFQEAATRRKEVERFCWRFAGMGALTSATILGCLWYVFGWRWVEGHRAVAAYAAIAILASAASTMAITRVRLSGSYSRVAVALTCAAISSVLVSLGVAFSWRVDAWALLLGAVASPITTLVILGVPRRAEILASGGLPRSTRRAVVSLGLAGSITAPMHWLIVSSDRWFIAEYGDPSQIGIYAMSANLALVGQMVNSALTLAWFPEASRIYGDQRSEALEPLGRLWSRILVGLALVWVAVSAAAGDALRLLTAPTFHAGTPYIPWLAGGVFFYGMSSLANTSLFLGGRMRYAAYLWLVGGSVSLVGNLLLVPLLGAYGAAVVQCASFAMIALAISTVSQRILRLVIPWRRLAVALMVALPSGVLMSPAWHAFPPWSLLCKLPVGLLVAALLVRTIAPDWYSRALRSAGVRT